MIRTLHRLAPSRIAGRRVGRESFARQSRLPLGSADDARDLAGAAFGTAQPGPQAGNREIPAELRRQRSGIEFRAVAACLARYERNRSRFSAAFASVIGPRWRSFRCRAIILIMPPTFHPTDGPHEPDAPGYSEIVSGERADAVDMLLEKVVETVRKRAARKASPWYDDQFPSKTDRYG
jgi:hypothetical protein